MAAGMFATSLMIAVSDTRDVQAGTRGGLTDAGHTRAGAHVPIPTTLSPACP